MADSDSDWLADDEATLRPEVARILAPADLNHIGARPRVLAGIGPAVATRVVLSIAGVLLLALSFHREAPEVRHLPLTAQDYARIAAQQAPHEPKIVTGRILADSAAVRAGAGLDRPLLYRLSAGDTVVLDGQENGWRVVGPAGRVSGWVYGAHVTHPDLGRGLGAAVIRRPVRDFLDAVGPGFRSGDRVYVERTYSDNYSGLVLPDGRRAAVPTDALQIVR